ncbi:MAG TPA: RNA-binding protein [Verrucomicrobiae bacterium]|nr:RNA-binding protein [Verrucomicrobiae bacterium]
MSQARLFVGNLSYQTGENDIQDYFAQAGAVTSVNLMLDKVTGKSRGFAFVEFATPEEAQKAIEQFHNKDFQGRAITVNVARPREERPPRWNNAGRPGGDRGDRRDFRGERRERY